MFRKYNIDLALDSPERTMVHSRIIRSKPSLRQVYSDWYTRLKEVSGHLPPGLKIELGSGGGFLKEFIPEVICTDIMDLDTNDMTFSAYEMPFDNHTVSGMFMVNVLHHIDQSESFLREASRVMKPGGMMFMIEPAMTLCGQFIFKNFHHEPCDMQGDWTFPSSGPLSGSNQALPWIIFERDKHIFENNFPEFRVEAIEYLYPFQYLFSGGLSREEFLPGFAFPVIRWIDRVTPKLWPQLSLFMLIRIGRKSH